VCVCYADDLAILGKIIFFTNAIIIISLECNPIVTIKLKPYDDIKINYFLK
jgi:hypothetical protein